MRADCSMSAPIVQGILAFFCVEIPISPKAIVLVKAGSVTPAAIDDGVLGRKGKRRVEKWAIREGHHGPCVLGKDVERIISTPRAGVVLFVL